MSLFRAPGLRTLVYGDAQPAALVPLDADSEDADQPPRSPLGVFLFS